MTTKTKVLNYCRGELGYSEGDNNSNKYASIAGHANNLPWCATFIVAAFRMSGLQLPSESAWTPSMLSALKSQGRQIDGPQPGALAFLYFPKLRRVAHMGIVESVRDDGRFVTIEGNTNTSGSRTGGMVLRKVRSTSGWTFAMPEYSQSTPSPTPQPKSGDDLVFPVLKVGSTGQHVRNLQGLLHAAGRNPGAIDGIYGPRVRDTVMSYQRAAGIPVDGMAGTQTFRALLGV